ncbi:putative bifunctional diguanylate cyclase/phosphodiesterase [Parasphingorhabdus cellanae]|uniref:EAL domain-containing protein n=1 Tax=Parasphingorhabdus cellanae TaxID=2806553 RepID=A0ABX7T300_9SPHN|nr:EAL domain-containing protein [Parasphingorhabdus cellanae]QTD55939.1 EAL domain-containing protein [Parasphingorhabdus cellanae]
MAVKGLLKAFSNSSSDESVAAISSNNQATRLEVLDDFEQAGINWLWATDAEGRFVYLSEKAAENLKIPVSEILTQPFTSLFENDPDNPDEKSDRPLHYQLSKRSKLRDLVVRRIPITLNREDRPTWWMISAHPKFDDSGNFQGYRGNAKDVTVEYQRKLEDSRLAEFDSLTGLANRHRMDNQLNGILGAFKAAGRSCAVMMLDLDRFKQVNDTMGHPAGDELLKQVATRIRKIIGDRGEIGRLGGDEFQVILPDLDDRGKLGEIAEKIVKIVSQPYPIDEKSAVIGTSIGVAVAPYDGVEKDELVRSSDLALYSAKNSGRGQFRFYSADLKDEEEERRLLVEDLRDALDNDQLELHYQPVVRTNDHMVVGFEGLMRWVHPERGAVSPGVFIPIAEELNLINQLGEWALRKACTDALQWPHSVRIAVNVSAVQFANSGFPEIVMNALAASGLNPERLELELTESVFMGDSETIDNTFKILKELGVRLALDDFGTGYSSLSYLRSAPFDKIKVDKSFVDSCTQQDKNSAKIIAAIVSLSEALGMETTVEGVEAFDQFKLVCSKGARYIQGWIYSKALRLDEIEEKLGTGEFRIEPDGPDLYRPDRRTVFRRIGAIHEDHRYDVVMRDLSKTGARFEGMLGVPVGTQLVLDLGGGQLVISTVIRAKEAIVATEFETPLVSDGAGGLCTRHRVSPYDLAAAGMPLAALPPGNYPLAQSAADQASKPKFMQVAI